jgi:predicted Zn-dependent protease
MRKILSLLFILSFIGNVWAVNQNYQTGWKQFSDNDRKGARKSFEAALSDPAAKADALLSLCLVDWAENKQEEAYKHFMEFYKASENPQPYLYALYSHEFLFEGRVVLGEEQIKFIKAALEDPKVNGTLKAMMHIKLGSHFRLINQNKKGKQEFDKMGAINSWQVLGTFDNTSGSGFNKDWGAVQKAKLSDVFKNEVDADVTWYTPSAVKHDNWFYFDYYFDYRNAIMYAQSFVTSPADQEVYLRAGNSGSLKIWVNDALVSSIADERNCDLDIYAYKVKLNKGANRILVQIGESETDAANFMVRLTDADANPIPGLVATAEYANYTKSSATTSAAVPFFAEAFFENKLKSSPDDLLSLLMLAEVYMHNDKSYDANKIYKKCQQIAPKSSFISDRASEGYVRAKNYTDQTKEIEKIKNNDPESFKALQFKYNTAQESEKYDEAEKLLKKIKELYGVSKYTELCDLQIASNQKRIPEVLQMAKDLYKKYPESSDLMLLNYRIEDNASKNSSKSIGIVKNYVKNYYDSDAFETLARIQFETGSAYEGIDMLKERIESMPYAVGFITQLADVYYSMQNYQAALETSQKALLLSPYIGSTYNTIGSIYKIMGKKELAMEAFQKSIYYDPTSYDSREQLRQLQEKKIMFDFFAKSDPEKIFENSPKADAYPEDHSLILLNEHQYVIYPEGAKEFRNELIVKVFNNSGIETWKEYQIGYNGYSQRLIVDKAEVFKSNGNKVQAESNNEGYIVFTNLEAGDAIHLEYRIQNYNHGKLAKHFWDQFFFRYTIPSLHSKYSVLLPKTKEFKYEILNGDIKPTIADIEDMKLYTWESRDQASVKTESYRPALVDIVPTLDISSIPDWKFVSNWYSDLSSTKSRTDFVLKETVSEILAGNEKASALEKARLFYNYICKNITYSNVSFMHGPIIPQLASRTITTRSGDCKDVSTLFVAMCKESGIKANLILVDTRSNGQKHLNLPSIEFDHCIAQLEADGKKYQLELTNSKLPFGAGPVQDLAANSLLIPREGEAEINAIKPLEMPGRKKNTVHRQTEIKIENNDFQLTRDNINRGSLSTYTRSRYADKGKDEIEKSMTKSVASSFTNQVKLTNITFKNLDDLADTVVYSYSLNAKNAVQDVAGMKILKMPWVDLNSNLSIVSLEKRDYPVLLWSYSSQEEETETIKLILPTGKLMVEKPKDIVVSCPSASYSLTYDSSKPGVLIAKRKFVVLKDIVSTAEYNEFRDFMNKVSEYDTKQYAFK